MGSWITCLCGGLIHTNLFAGATVYRLISDEDYDALGDSIDRDKLESLFFDKGIPVYRCPACNRLVIQWDKEGTYLFYMPEGEKPGQAATEDDTALREQADLRRLKELEDIAEAEYTELYDSCYPTGAYSNTKEVFYDANAFADKIGRTDEAERLRKRLQQIKEIFRHQFV
jgi:hypothetical protein